MADQQELTLSREILSLFVIVFYFAETESRDGSVRAGMYMTVIGVVLWEVRDFGA